LNRLFQKGVSGTKEIRTLTESGAALFQSKHRGGIDWKDGSVAQSMMVLGAGERRRTVFDF